MILITGGAGFIGANFVLDWIAGSDEPVVNVNDVTVIRQLLQDLVSGYTPAADIVDWVYLAQT